MSDPAAEQGPPVPPYFVELFARLPRQGPGLPECTRRALAATGLEGTACRVADVGCGGGAATLDLAQRTTGRVTGVDLLPPVLDRLRRAIEEEGLTDRVDAVAGDMARLDELFEPGGLDLLWCEGAIYNVGFAEGLRAWRGLLRPGGLVAVTEVTWLTDAPDPACAAFWNEEYPAITTPEVHRAAAREAGYEVVEDFPLPREAWTRDFYDPLREVVAAERRREDLSADEAEVLDVLEREMGMHERFGDEYGYTFYVLQRGE